MAVDFILLDTSVLSEARKAARELNENIVAFLRQIPAGALAVPQAAVFELRRGALLLSKTDPVRGNAFARWLDQLLETDIWIPPVGVDVRGLIARMSLTPDLASFWVSNSKQRKMKFGCDPEIAATSIVHRLPIASTDISDYMRIHRYFPIPGLYCPLRGRWHIDPPEGWRLRESMEPEGRDWRQMIGPIDWGGGEEDLGESAPRLP